MLLLGIFSGGSTLARPVGGVEEAAGTTAVEVPVYVLDDKGNPVVDLKPNEFQVHEDGRRQSLLFAQRVDALAAALPSAGGHSSEIGPDGTGRIVQAPRRFVLLFDLLFNSLSGIKRAREGAWRFVTTQLSAQDLVAVFSFSRAAGMVMCTNFTADRRRIYQALDELGAKPTKAAESSAGLTTGGLSPEGKWRSTGPSVGIMATSLEGLPDSFIAQNAEELSIHYEVLTMLDRRAYQAAVTDYLFALGRLARSLDVIPGRKLVVLFSSGFDMGRVFLNWSEFEEGISPSLEYRLRGDTTRGEVEAEALRRAEEAMRAFSSSSCMFYAVDTAGLPASDGRASSGWRSPSQSLAFLASEAGGRFSGSFNRLDQPLRSIDQESAHYYVLAYEPPFSSSTGTYHKIKVEVSRPGVSISYRTGYYEPKPFGQYSGLERDLQIADIVHKGRELDAIAFSAAAFGFRPDSEPWRSFSQVMVQLVIPGVSDGQQPLQRLEVYGFAIAADGSIADSFHGVPDLSRPEIAREARQQGVIYSDLLLVSPASYQIVTIIRDTVTGATGVRRLAFTARDFGGKAPCMASPCFILTGSRMVRVLGFDALRTSDRFLVPPPPYPLVLEGKQCVAAPIPALPTAGYSPLLVKLYNFPADAATGRPRVRIESWISGTEGRARIQAALKPERILLRAAGEADVLCSFRPPSLDVGLHMLSISATDPMTGERLVDSVAFRTEVP